MYGLLGAQRVRKTALEMLDLTCSLQDVKCCLLCMGLQLSPTDVHSHRDVCNSLTTAFMGVCKAMHGLQALGPTQKE